ncbi:hypothetical protein PANT_10d00104 [Moesziomyces antarcticus T-34]|uniref:CRAL-TRIO domain-containing protein n=1 Tax=Pseudozyma antarctica (strain T-34) TaxID=1151754 RepID=M9MFE6_PSEA3|nr:hypothetical protein PANT_10d00104 [Moesziomyces antarcticus T-34]
MPSAVDVQSKDARAVQEKHLDLTAKYKTHLPQVEQLLATARSQILDDVTHQLQLNDEGKARVLAYLADFANIFRFYRRSRYDHDQAITLLTATILWRMRTDLDLLSLASLNPLYVTPPAPNPPLFWVNSGFRDLYGRPCGIINLRSVERTAENTLDQLKEYIVACMEMMRRYVADLFRSTNADSNTHTVLQASIAVDLASSGMANLELELLPFLLDLLKNHVPGMVGAVYVLNYGWVHAGMWAVIKRVLPQQALAKIFFPSYAELKDHFEPRCIPACYGGQLDVQVEAATNDVLRKYGRPRRVSSASLSSPPQSPGMGKHLSRSSSYESIYEVFYSADSTPWASRSMTPRHSEPSTPRGDARAKHSLSMTPSAARKLRHLQMSRGDLSNAAEHAHDPSVRAAGRSRSGSASDTRIIDGRAVGLSVNTATSPFVTPMITPVASPRLVRSRADRHVRFSSDRARDRSASPQRRVGGTASFTLYLPNDEEAVLPSESEDSDASGKDGEVAPVDAQASGGLLHRLRRLSETRFTKGKQPQHDHGDDHEGEGEGKDGDGTVMYIEPASPRLQVEHLDEPPLQHVPHTFLSHRTRRSARDGLVSPYNANNPFFGYPAFTPGAPTFRLDRSATPQHLHQRRRKRDLLRTLTYLFVLRILAFHRRLRWRLSLVWREVARTLAVGAHNAEGDDFWRKLDASRLSALPPSQAGTKRDSAQAGARGKALVSVAQKMLGAAALVMLLRPEMRRRAVTQVYAAVGASWTRDTAATSVDWDEWEKRSAVKPTPSHSYTGLHVRQRLLGKASTETGVKTHAGGQPGKGRSRYAPLAVAGGVVSAASLAYLLYTYLSSSSGKDDDDVAERRSSPRPSSSRSPRPSLSLSLSSSFTRDAASISSLRTLLGALAPEFIVHLIVPGSSADLTASIQALTTSLGAIPDFDARRVLEYSQGGARFALARALACDCHLDLALPGSREPATATELAKITRTALVVFASLDPTSASEGGGAHVVAELRRAAPDGRNAPNGMRVFDLGQSSDPWREVAERMHQLRSAWS